jgi:hypothetical protein
LIRDLEDYHTQLERALADEYREIVVGGIGIPPSEAARIVAAGKAEDDWIPAPVALGQPCPLSYEEVRELYATNSSTSADDDRNVDHALPKVTDLLPPEQIEQLFHSEDDLKEHSVLDRRYWPSVRFSQSHIQFLPSLKRELRAILEALKPIDPWKLAAIEVGRSNRLNQSPWASLLRKIEETERLDLESQEQLILHRPEVSDRSTLQTQLTVAGEILGHLQKGGRLGSLTLILRPGWKAVLSGWRVNGRRGTRSRVEPFVK